MLKIVKNYFPEVIATKSTTELTFECVAELVFILLSVYFIDRFASYFTPYSGLRYEKLDLTQTILIFMVVLFTIQTKLGTKMNIVLDRITNSMEGYSNKKPTNNAFHERGAPPIMGMSALPDEPTSPQSPIHSGHSPSIIPSGNPGPGAPGMSPLSGGDLHADGPVSMQFASELSGSIY